ncbi:hypothetical protein A3841_11145 [Pontibacter flavimaris]|uniref:Uncharacterized protein n=1 Tax=Pontibacter flavimaris TaxID=1797110 RepID=A0A1Q5PHA1_9BACT|nr:hypothetical protein A3841_11145 [Pontibacter flavimaris]
MNLYYKSCVYLFDSTFGYGFISRIVFPFILYDKFFLSTFYLKLIKLIGINSCTPMRLFADALMPKV